MLMLLFHGAALPKTYIRKHRKCFLDELTLVGFLVCLMAVEKAQKQMKANEDCLLSSQERILNFSSRIMLWTSEGESLMDILKA